MFFEQPTMRFVAAIDHPSTNHWNRWQRLSNGSGSRRAGPGTADFGKRAMPNGIGLPSVYVSMGASMVSARLLYIGYPSGVPPGTPRHRLMASAESK